MTKPDHPKNNQERSHSKLTIYDRLDRWFITRTKMWILVTLAVGLVVGVLTFDIKPSTGGDDTGYILQAMDIVSTGHVPIGFRTPGYPLVLALFVWMIGVKLVLLKTTSLLFFLGIILSLFFVFRNRLQPIVIYPLLLLVAINPLFLEYAHQTYSEMFFALLLVWTIHYILRANETGSLTLTLLAAILTMASFYIRVAGVTIAGVALFFFIYQRRWKQFGIFILACAILYSPMKIYEWTYGTAAFGQASILLLKNPYNTLQGTETLSGFIERFINNVVNHLNYQCPVALGLPMPPELGRAGGSFIPSISAFFGVLISVVLLIGCVTPIIVKSKSTLAFLGGFVIVYIAFISIALQNLFATPRMLVPIIPYLFIGTLEGFSRLGNRWAKVIDTDAVSIRAKTLVLVAIIGLTFTSVVGTKQSIDENYPILKANLGGNEFAGFTEDWVNYLRASLWIKENLPMQTTGIICRKPELFLLYAGNYHVYGTYKIDEIQPDSLIAKWKAMNLTHLLYDNFQWSSTLRRYIQPVAEKYPQIFELVHQEGAQFPSYIFHLNYSSARDSIVRQKESRQ